MKEGRRSIVVSLRVFLSVILLGTCCLSTAEVRPLGAPSYEILPYNPLADAKAVVVQGNARFTGLTDRLLRLEYSSNGRFEDRATVAVVNRMLAVPAFTSSVANNVLTITTNTLKLQYEVGKPFDAPGALTITALKPGYPFSTWQYGLANDGNLLGTIKSLDELLVISLNCDANKNVKIHEELLHCEWGLISTQGWVVYNDTTNWGLDSRFWWDSPNKDSMDLYFFGHGHDYKGALSDYIAIGGKTAMVPRYASGIWWSRWYNINNLDVQSIVNDYATRFLPLDVYILDMDWHAKHEWGGYTIDSHLFPFPSETFGWLHSKGLVVAANLHDADGVHPFEKSYQAMCQALGLNPSDGKVIPFSSVNASYLFALDDVVLKDVENQGMDFWWIDWQQGGTTGGSDGNKQNPTYILNHLRGTDHIRRGENKRGIVLARWGGLGTHRYQVGFSGDVVAVSWAALAFQPYFSFTASNVGYGFWSHDIVGTPTDFELHSRWIQWGAYSAIFRTHDRGMAVGECADSPEGCPRIKIWDVPDKYFVVNREAVLQRISLVPYIYTAVREAFDNGVSILRPMYYEFPELKMAYAGDSSGKFGQYFFGPSMFVAPIVTPVNTTNSMASSSIWIPPGVWFEYNSGQLVTGDVAGDTILTKQWDLSEIPVFVKAGAVIPKLPVRMGDTIGLAGRQYEQLVVEIYPGTASGATNVYEDDGITNDYLKGAFTWTSISYSRTSTTVDVTIDKVSGSFTGAPTARKYYIELLNSLPLTSVTIGSTVGTYSTSGGPNTWRYDGESFKTIIETDFISTTVKTVISATTGAVNDQFMSGLKGILRKATLAKRNLDPSWSTPGSVFITDTAYLEELSASAVALTYHANDPTTFNPLLKNVPVLFSLAIAEIEALQPQPPAPPGALVQLWNADRNDNCLCGSQDCLNDNADYTTLRIEGYQPKPGTDGTVPLFDFWDATITDNFATTNSTTPTGYIPAAFANGIVFEEQQANTVPLVLYWSEERQDMLTVASTAGLLYARQNKYSLVTSVVGYVYSSPQEEVVVDQVNFNRWLYSLDLLYSAKQQV